MPINSNNDTPENAVAVPQLMLQSAKAPDWADGSAEPWIADVLAALLIANGTKTAIEIGGFQAFTSKRLAAALAKSLHKTSLTICEIDPERATAVRVAIAGPAKAIVNNVTVVCANSLDWIPTLADASVDFVWLDGCHEKPHVLQELHLLLGKLAPGGIIAGHDVFGVCDLQEVFALVASQMNCHSMSLDLPRLGPAGGIGILQRPR